VPEPRVPFGAGDRAGAGAAARSRAGSVRDRGRVPFSEKVETTQLLGYVAIIAQHHSGSLEGRGAGRAPADC